jgi:TonB-dependent receptor
VGIALGVVFGMMLHLGVPAVARQEGGSIRGVVRDRDFDAPLAAAQVEIVETGRKVLTTDQGNYVAGPLPPGKYTLVFSKEGYVRQVRAEVVVAAGRLTEVNVSLSGDFTEMEEFVVQETLQLAPGSEAALLQLRLESPALMDSISADLMSRAGASDAASALRLVPGASLQDGKSAVIRGLPDRYVSSQLNGVRLPTADEDKRAVELDQFPAPVIESIQVAKTFTPDQQGDASGGAVDVRLKGIPDEAVLQFKMEGGFNSQVYGEDDFLTYKGGGFDFWGRDDCDRGMQLGNLGRNWDGAVGVSEDDAPFDYKFSGAAGGKHEFDNGVKIGGFLSFFYERDSSFTDDGFDDSYWVTSPGAPMTPQTFQGVPTPAGGGDFKTGLYDVTEGTQSVQWGGLGAFGIETENHSINLAYLYTRTTEDTATLAEDTRGKEYFFPGYDPDDPTTPGHEEPLAAPYVRLETLECTEQTTGSLQLNGRNRLPIEEFGIFRTPEIDWLAAFSSADLDQPDKRQFGTYWIPERDLGPIVIPPTHYPYKPSDNINLGNLQRIWLEIDEESQLHALNLKLPFESWAGNEGFLKFGYFYDKVDRTFDQDTFSNFGDEGSFVGGFEEPWSGAFPSEDHPITASDYDVDYDGEQEISAWYAMAKLPLFSRASLVGGVRVESTEIGIVNHPEALATWFPPGATAPVQLNPGDADVSFDQVDLLPSIGLEVKPIEALTLRASYSETVARQTFKELTPILQQEFLGGPIFIGNPSLGMSRLKNYDLRADVVPFEGSFFSASWFHKDIEDPIEYVQKVVTFRYTTAVNYPEGEIDGWEFEARQELGRLWSPLRGLAVGANATFLDTEVTLPKEEQDALNHPNIQAPMKTRDMTNAPEHLYNLYATYDLAATGTQIGAFYTVQGDTLLAGAGQSINNFVPSLYAKEYGTLNLSLAQRLGKHFKFQFQAKNLTNPKIKTVYRSQYIGDDVTKSSFTRGVDYTFAVGAEFRF